MNVLVLNCGSSSIKYQLLNMNDEPEPILKAKGIVERIGISDGIVKHKAENGDKHEYVADIADHTVGIKHVIEMLTHEKYGVIKSLEEINAVGHRVAHGGEHFNESVLLDTQAINKIEAICDLAPLHNPAHLKGMRAIIDVLPFVPQTAVFDTSFHQSMPPHSYMYALPYEMYEKYKIRRYGFHGTSHKFVAEKACDILNWNINEKNIISCHLGNGASICAIKNGQSYDTSMGFTPVEGLMMGTRTGDLDLGALLFIMEKENLSISEANSFINKKCGSNGFSKISSDMRDLEEASDKGNERATLTLQMFAHRVKKYIGAYMAIMNGVDLIIMTAGIGENSDVVRKMVFSDMENLGIVIDNEINKDVFGRDEIISKPESKVKLMTVTTDEEMVIALDTKRIIKEKAM